MASDQSSIVDTRGDRVMTMLRERALGAMARAYAPYSQFRVGAALLGADGSVTEGCNVENASFPAGICAERSAVAAAVARGIRSFDAITIEEFSPHLLVVSVTSDGREARWTLDDLLPRAFTPKSLDRR